MWQRRPRAACSICLNSRFGPQLEARSWVYDINSRAEGHTDDVRQHTIEIVKALKDGLTDLDLELSDTSRNVGYPREIAIEITDEAKRLGI